MATRYVTRTIKLSKITVLMLDEASNQAMEQTVTLYNECKTKKEKTLSDMAATEGCIFVKILKEEPVLVRYRMEEKKFIEMAGSGDIISKEEEDEYNGYCE